MKMKYTWRVATESLRMYPPVFCSFRKVLQDIELGGYIIPKGWQVFWSPCITHMDASIYPDPLKFDPSRHENQGAVPPYSYIAFGAGPRMCPGYEFARIETLTMIHYLVTGFKWKLCLQENLFGRDPMPVFGEGLPIQVEMIRTDWFNVKAVACACKWDSWLDKLIKQSVALYVFVDTNWDHIIISCNFIATLFTKIIGVLQMVHQIGWFCTV